VSFQELPAWTPALLTPCREKSFALDPVLLQYRRRSALAITHNTAHNQKAANNANKK
jgi:hypothetical protein